MNDVSSSLAESGYVGWVVWIDGSPVFQQVPKNPGLAPVMSGAEIMQTRVGDRQTVDWKDLDHPRISRLEVYGFHEHYTEQPLIRLDRAPGAQDIRYACMTMNAIAFGPGIIGQKRTGIIGWKVGWFNPLLREFDLWEITKTHRRRLNPHGNPQYLVSGGPACKGHPCWPIPHGFGIAPYVFGLTERDVPSAPGLA